jgi:flagellin
MTVNSIANSQLSTIMARLSSGLRINSARDDAAGLGISELMTAQIRGLDQGTRNVLDMQSLVNTAEGGLSTITDNLQRLRELTLQASNGIYTDADRGRLQHEANQLIDEINSVTDRLEFNSMRLLDGSFSVEDNRPGLHTAADAQGRGPTVSIGNMSAGRILGPGDFDLVNGDRQALLGRIDNALSMVSNQRSYLGAMHNRFDHTISNNQIANLNLSAARSRIRDQDMALGMMQLHQQNVLQQAQLMSQRNQQEQQRMPLLSLLM